MRETVAEKDSVQWRVDLNEEDSVSSEQAATTREDALGLGDSRSITRPGGADVS